MHCSGRTAAHRRPGPQDPGSQEGAHWISGRSSSPRRSGSGEDLVSPASRPPARSAEQVSERWNTKPSFILVGDRYIDMDFAGWFFFCWGEGGRG